VNHFLRNTTPDYAVYSIIWLILSFFDPIAYQSRGGKQKEHREIVEGERRKGEKREREQKGKKRGYCVHLVLLLLDGLDGGLELVRDIQLVGVKEQDDAISSLGEPSGKGACFYITSYASPVKRFLCFNPVTTKYSKKLI
jgi:hypothetical protein